MGTSYEDVTTLSSLSSDESASEESASEESASVESASVESASEESASVESASASDESASASDESADEDGDATASPPEDSDAVITEDFEVDIEAEEETTSSLPETTAAPGVEEATTEEEFVGSLPEPDEDKPNEQTFIPVIIGPDGSPQIAPGYEGPGPSGSGMYNCTELGGGVFNCTIVAGPCKGDNLVTSDAMAVKNHIENIAAGNLCGTAGTGAASGPGLGQPEPESPAGPATAEPSGSTASSSPAEDDAEEAHFHSLPLSSMTYQEICGKTPWLNKTFRAQHASPRYRSQLGGTIDSLTRPPAGAAGASAAARWCPPPSGSSSAAARS